MSTSERVTDGFVTLQQIAQQMGVTHATARQWLALYGIPHLRLGRTVLVPLDALKRLIAREEGCK